MKRMGARPGQDATVPVAEERHEPLPPRLRPARGVVLGVAGGVLVWLVLIAAYFYTR